MTILKWILSWFGGGPLGKIADALTKAYEIKLNARTEEEKIQAQADIDRLHVLAADTANARAAAAGLPTWMAVIGFMIGFPFALHLFFVGMGTTFAPLLVGGVFDWMLRIPKWPAPLDQSELGIIAFFFGASAVIGGAGAIANAIVRRK